MTTINLTTKINASKQIVFDASRNIDIHQQSASPSKEKAIAGVTSGLINLNETVTWRGNHFGFYLTHKSRITAMNLYYYFVDEMEEGHFKSFKQLVFYNKINNIFGQQKIRLGSQDRRIWKMRQEKLSPMYTTKLSDIITVKV